MRNLHTMFQMLVWLFLPQNKARQYDVPTAPMHIFVKTGAVVSYIGWNAFSWKWMYNTCLTWPGSHHCIYVLFFIDTVLVVCYCSYTVLAALAQSTLQWFVQPTFTFIQSGYPESPLNLPHLYSSFPSFKLNLLLSHLPFQFHGKDGGNRNW